MGQGYTGGLCGAQGCGVSWRGDRAGGCEHQAAVETPVRHVGGAALG